MPSRDASLQRTRSPHSPFTHTRDDLRPHPTLFRLALLRHTTRVLRALFQLSPALQAAFESRWGTVGKGPLHGEVWGGHDVGVQIRRGLWHVGSKGAANDKGLLSDEGEALLLTCARRLARNNTRFFLVTDDATARARARIALSPHPVAFLEAPLVHSGLERQGQEGQNAVFLDWWVLGETHDAVLSDSSSFGYAAAARGSRWCRENGEQGEEGVRLSPITVWNSDTVRPVQALLARVEGGMVLWWVGWLPAGDACLDVVPGHEPPRWLDCSRRCCHGSRRGYALACALRSC